MLLMSLVFVKCKVLNCNLSRSRMVPRMWEFVDNYEISLDIAKGLLAYVNKPLSASTTLQFPKWPENLDAYLIMLINL